MVFKEIILPQGYFELMLAFLAAAKDGDGATTSAAMKWLKARGSSITISHAASVRRRLVGDKLLGAKSREKKTFIVTTRGEQALRDTARSFKALSDRATEILPIPENSEASR